MNEKKGTLSAPDIKERLLSDIAESSHIDVTPLSMDAIKGASLEVHLGNWFAVARRTKIEAVDLNNPAQRHLFMFGGMEEVFIQSGGTFLIHPGDLVLGATLEFLALPDDVMAFVEGKSSLGRMGLIVATATQIAPGFHGVVVLELANAGTVPLKLEAGPSMPIAQLVFVTMTGRVPEEYLYHGQYHCQIKPLSGPRLPS